MANVAKSNQSIDQRIFSQVTNNMLTRRAATSDTGATTESSGTSSSGTNAVIAVVPCGDIVFEGDVAAVAVEVVLGRGSS